MEQLDESLEAIESVMRERIAQKREVMERWRGRKERAAEREEALLDELTELELALSVLRRVVGKSTLREDFGALDTKRLRTQTVPDSCYDIIREKGGRAKVTEIIDILIGVGKLKTNRRTAYATVATSMQRDDRFVKVGPGEFGLLEIEDAQDASAPRPRNATSGDLILD